MADSGTSRVETPPQGTTSAETDDRGSKTEQKVKPQLDMVQNEYINTMWEDAEKIFEAIAEEKLKHSNLHFSDVKAEITKRGEANSSKLPSKDEKEVSKWERAKKRGKKILKAGLDWLGVLVRLTSTIAPMAIPGPFQPATDLCCNVLLILISVPKAIEDFEAEIEDAFDTLSGTLEQINIYGTIEQIPTPLSRVWNTVILDFITVCAHAVRLQKGGRIRKTWGAIKTILPEGLSQTDSLAAAVGKFQNSLKIHTRVEGAAILATTTSTHVVVSDYVTDRKKSTDRTRYLDQIREAFKLKPTVSDNSTMTPGWDSALKLAASYNGGGWICEPDSIFSSWLETGPGQGRLLWVKGPAQSGKSVAVALMTQHLESKREARASVAHFFFPRFFGDSGEDQAPVLSALKLMAFQLAQQDDAVAKTLAKDYEDGGDKENRLRNLGRPGQQVQQLWKDLKLGAPGSGATYYFVFEGVTSLMDHHTESATALLEILLAVQGQVKVILSGEEDGLKDFAGRLPLCINMQDFNAPDMRRYISNYLDTHHLLPVKEATRDDSVLGARELILRRLPERAKGKYSSLNVDLAKTKRLLQQQLPDLGDLERLLEGDENMGSHQGTIDNLQQDLEPTEIDEVNDMLRWFCAGPMRQFTVSFLQSALRLQSGKRTIQPLRDRISTRYAAVFDLNENDNTVRIKDGMYDVVTSRKRAKKVEAGDKESTISCTIKITNASEEVARHFFWDLTQMAVRDGFRFHFNDESAVSQRRLIKDEVGVNQVDANLALVNAAFKFLDLTTPGDIEYPVAEYILINLPNNLRKLLDAPSNRDQGGEAGSQFTVAERRDLIVKMRDMFQSDHYLNQKCYDELFMGFFWGSDDLPGFEDLLADKDLVRQVDKTWARDIQNEADRLRRHRYLGPWIRCFVRRWLREDKWRLESILPWIIVLSNCFVGNLFNVEEAIEWAKREVLPSSEQIEDFMWYNRLGETWLTDTVEPLMDRWKSVEMFEKAVTFPEAGWKTHRGLARAYKRFGRYEKGRSESNNSAKERKWSKTPRSECVRQYLQAIVLCEESAKNVDDVAALEIELAHYWEDVARGQQNSAAADAWDKARGLFESAVARAPGNTHARFLVIRHYARTPADNPKWRDYLRDAIDHILRPHLDKEEHDLMADIFTKINNASLVQPKILQAIFQACHQGRQIIYQGLSAAKRRLEAKPNESLDENLLYAEAAVAYHYHEPENKEEENVRSALEGWRKCLELTDTRRGTAFDRSIISLTFHYFSRLVSCSSEEAATYLQELQSLDKYNSASSMEISYSVSLRTSYLVRHGREEDAKNLLRGFVEVALGTMDDDDETNDEAGYKLFAGIFSIMNDVPNAIAALSWLGVPDQATYRPLPVSDRFLCHNDHYPEVDRIRKEAARRACELVPEATNQRERLVETIRQIKRLEIQEMAVPEDGFGSAYDIPENDSEPDYASGDDDPPPKSRRSSLTPAEAKEGDDAGGAALEKVDEKRLRYRNLAIWLGKELRNFKLTPPGSLTFNCLNSFEGCCDNKWGFDQAMFFCMHCIDHALCGPCHEKVRDPDSDHFIDFLACHASHSWIKVPPWGHPIYSARHLDVSPSVGGEEDGGNEGTKSKWMMFVGGTAPVSEDGKVVDASAWTGYQTMGEAEWIKQIRNRWGIPRPEINKIKLLARTQTIMWSGAKEEFGN